MELRRNKFIYVVASIFALLMVAFTLAACGSKKETYEVTFNVQDDSSVWNVYKTVTVDNGTVEMPADPAKEYYTFSGWYLDQNLTGDQFKNENLGSNVNVYAKFVAVQVNVYINGQSEGEKDLVTVVKGSYNPGEGLTFDGWYTDSNYTVKWNGTDVTQNLYAKSVATITFNNGYEDVYETYVNPNTVYESPKTQKITVTTKDSDGNETSKEGTVESLKITKSYMATRDISYVDENGDAFDFTKAITKNTTITVNWRSPLLKYAVNTETNNLCVTQYGSTSSYYLDDTENKKEDGKTSKYLYEFPAISILGKITYDADNDGVDEEYTVDSVNVDAQGFLSSTTGSAIKTLIIGEGIKFIQNIVGATPTTLETVKLPSTLKVIQNCFNNCNNLKEITIPNGVEVIIGSFFANTEAASNSWAYRLYNIGENYSFDITIPESVINLSMVPSNLTFSHTKATAEDKDFYKDGDYIYQKVGNDIILVGDYTTSDVVSVAEGVNAIQVGTYFNRSITKLYLPSTFSYVKYNESASKYPYVKFQPLANTALYLEEYAEDPKASSMGQSDKMPAFAYTIFNKVEGLELLCFSAEKSPETLHKYAFLGDQTTWAAIGAENNYESYTATAFADKVVYVSESENPVVTVVYTNETNGFTSKLTINKDKNSTLTYEEILGALDALKSSNIKSVYTDGSLNINYIKSFEKDYDLSTPITTNACLELSVSFVGTASKNPVTVEKTTGGAKVTGINAEGAIKDENGKYVVIIPSSVTISGETLSVIEIAEGAFKDNTTIGVVVIPNTVKIIGSEAFLNTANLTNIDLTNVKLQTIGESAFEGSSITSLTLALSELKNVGAYAFKTTTLINFLPAQGEEDRSMLTKNDLTEGDFFFAYEKVQISYATYAVGLYQYKSTTIDTSGNKVYNVDYVASTYEITVLKKINLGLIEKDEDGNFLYIISYTVLEGSIYNLANGQLIINAVSKFKSLAITDSTLKSTAIKYSSYFYSTRVTKVDKLIEGKPEAFESNWLEDVTEFSNIICSLSNN